jgi:hypothetical protein
MKRYGGPADQTPAGEIVLMLISDDNFSALQRTELLQFTLMGNDGVTDVKPFDSLYGKSARCRPAN